MKKAAIYARVSTLDQNPKNQIIELKDYAKRRGFKIIWTYIDRASGAKASRPAINDLMTAARAGNFDVLLIWRLDRLGRSLQHLIQIVEELHKHKIDIVSMAGEIDTTSSNGRLIFHIFGAIAEFERELIIERINLGIARARKEGKHIGRRKGQKDSKPRRKSGYYRRWAKPSKKPPPSNTEEINRVRGLG